MKTKKPSTGFALLTFMIVMVGLGAFGLSKMLDSSVQDKQELAKEKTRTSLLEAKEALLSYAVEFLAVNDMGAMARLPCPDVSNSWNFEGSQDPTCGDKGANSLGLFPFKTVGLGKLEDGNGQCLWYAVSGSYKNSPDMDLVNWDTNGMLTVEDENGNLKHSSDPSEYPIAVLIAPGAVISGQDRTPDAAQPLCGGNFNRSNYLESGSNLDYSTYTTDDVGNVWSFLDASLSSSLKNSDSNDQIVYITRKELWDRIKKTKQLSTNSATSPIKDLTNQLAECLIEYGDVSPANQQLIFAGKLVLPSYEEKANYKDKTGRLFGRFPQNIHKSNHFYGLKLSHTAEKLFVISSGGNGFCETKTGLDPSLWENWKDHFFVVIAKDFAPDSAIPFSSRCTSYPGSNCLNINGRTNVAAIIFFAKERSGSQDRDLSSYTNDDSISDRMGVWNQYLNGAANQHAYDGTAATNTYGLDPDDYAVCIIKNATDLSVVEC